MKLTNFHINNDNIALNYNGHYLDIHNNYDFRGFNLDTLSNQLELKWTRSNEEWANEKLCGFKLVFQNVTFLKIKERDSGLPFTEDTCMNFICFSPQNMRNDFGGYVEPQNVTEEDDLNINFESEQGFKINSSLVELIELTEEIIYVSILGEGTKVWRPMWADRLEEGIYFIKSFPTYNSTEEELEFSSGETVVCKRQKLFDGHHLVAIKKI